VDEPPFKLSGDDTMRRLRTIAQAPGELKWRLELLATLERMRMEQEVATRSILQNQRAMQKTLQSLTPVELAKSINREIDSHEKSLDSERYRAGWKQFRNHLITAVTSIAAAYLLWTLRKYGP
jgi:hypothetical protein